GFYVSFINHDNYDDVLNIVEATLNDVLNATEVPACNEVQCGWAASHSLEGAKTIAQAFLDKRNEWHDVFGTGK
ncbi:S-ribosylhomocysteine lyase, partial [Staphylococcus aureus]|nr:S-ribosylhomocysteine lyase [Staphylococcus aureus]MCD0937333.1 S-ribosylhomocysteine lyase [Staphylococcus aureus]